MNTTLNLPFSKKSFLVSGSANDQSIIGALNSTNGYYEAHIMRFLSTVVNKKSICLDIGANIGVISLCLSELANKGRIYAFEPSETNFHYLNENIKNNGLRNIIPYHLGIFDKKCDLSFSYVDHVAGCSFICEECGFKEGATEVIHCEKLDEFMKNHKINHLDFIKLDVEGAEVKALNGASATITSMKPNLVIEFNPTPMQRFFNEDPKNLFSLLTKLYPYIYLLPDNNDEPVTITDYKQLSKIIGLGKGWEDLYCSYRQL